MPALLFGSISTLADTSELQRAAFNQAFADHGLDWHWDQDEYRSLLQSNGGAARVAAYAQERGENVDADAVHETKSKIFQDKLASSAAPRPGVVDSIRSAKDDGLKLGFVTTTSRDNIAALFEALQPQIQASDFDVVLTSEDVDQGKPDPSVYERALERLDETAAACVAVEDNVGGVQAAAAAGIPCVAFPNENTAQHDFGTTKVAEEPLNLEELKDA